MAKFLGAICARAGQAPRTSLAPQIIQYTMSHSTEELALLGTITAIEMSKGKSKEEIKEIKALVAQVLATLNTIIYS